jgi:uncharacterized SAM-binding protein YcdF (DUF218 family)
MGFAVKKIIAAFLLPPGCIILLLIACAAFQLRRRRPAVAVALLFPALLLWVLSCSVVSGPLMASLERGLTIPAHPKGDVIVLLGGGLNDRVPDLSGSGSPSDNMQSRILTAARLQHRLGLPVLVTGGAVFAGRSPEAPVVKRFLVDLGVPPEKILIEEKSRDTAENARFSRKILEQEGFKKPILVTSAFHMRRSIVVFRKAGLVVIPVPSSFRTAPGLPTFWFDWLPSSGSLETAATAIHEYLGLIFYTLSGKGNT